MSLYSKSRCLTSGCENTAVLSDLCRRCERQQIELINATVGPGVWPRGEQPFNSQSFAEICDQANASSATRDRAEAYRRMAREISETKANMRR